MGTTLPAMVNKVKFYSKHLRKSLRVFKLILLHTLFTLSSSSSSFFIDNYQGSEARYQIINLLAIISKSIMTRAGIKASIRAKQKINEGCPR